MAGKYQFSSWFLEWQGDKKTSLRKWLPKCCTAKGSSTGFSLFSRNDQFDHVKIMQEYDVEFYMKRGLNKKEAIEYKP